MTKGAIFDVDGTLLDTMPLWKNAAGNYLNSIGVEVDTPLIETVFSKTLPESARFIRDEYHLDATIPEILDGIMRSVYMGYLKTVDLKPGAREFLLALHERDIPMAIVSSGTEELIRPAFRRLGIEDLFTAYFASSETGVHKRQPTMFLDAAESIGTHPRNTWVFEDAAYAAAVADKAGFHTIGIADETSAAEEQLLRSITEDFWEVYPPRIPSFLL